MNGKGIFKWPDGKIFEGYYKNDKKEGYGIFKWADGRIYKGMWKKGKQNGEGFFFNPKYNLWKKGIWDNGEKVKWITENDND